MSDPWHYLFLSMLTAGASFVIGIAAALGVLLCLYKAVVAVMDAILRRRWQRARLEQHKAEFAGILEGFLERKATADRETGLSPDDDLDDPTLTTGGQDD